MYAKTTCFIASLHTFRRVFYLTAGRPSAFVSLRCAALRTMISYNIKSLKWHEMLQIHICAAYIHHSWRRR